MTQKFHVLIEQDEDGWFTGTVPELKGCVTQGETIKKLMKNIKEAIELCLEVKDNDNNPEHIKFVDVQQIEV